MPTEPAPDVLALIDAIKAYFPDIGGTVTEAAEARRILAAAPAWPFEPPVVGSVEDRAIPGPEGAPDIPVRVYLPSPAPPTGTEPVVSPRPTVVFFHGGGWVIGGLDTHDPVARALCRDAGAAVVSVGYRLAPEARFPAAVDDAYAALCWAAEHIGELGADQDALVVAGDSAGGNLAAVAALVARDRGGPDLALQVLLYPATDARPGAGAPSTEGPADGPAYFLTATQGRWFAEQYFGPDGDRAHPYASPLLADPHGLPPAHVVTAGFDPLCDEGHAYAVRLREAGVRVTEIHYPGMFHGFFGFPELLADARAAHEAVADVIASTVSGRKKSGEGGGCAG
ncbi:alpha/beta hydrolase fold domain-containing protein [Streptomyces sp. NBC_00568]|uniref:alpha/beta hydrolase fold domain-containing protein n=1 Tax=Streptomyces sp. NBC_00568 TaxID=2975779 RepID=UPI00224D88D2|nr:alpha/beta hydrolase fold domain-containing protein [Streptomyces sp. NBC_00568]MCX4992727.1 alpha/beta hydrolase fold domain-containing protein [Streptomyces sp. NBC_00568]